MRAGGRATVQYIAVLNSVYRRVAMVAAGAASAPLASPFWHGDMDVGGASDHRIGNVYESISGVWFIERRYDKIMDLLCFIIDIQAPRLDSPMMPEALRGSESLVWGGFSLRYCSPFRSTVASTAKGPPWRWSRTAGRANSGWLTGAAATITCAAPAWKSTTWSTGGTGGPGGHRAAGPRLRQGCRRGPR